MATSAERAKEISAKFLRKQLYVIHAVPAVPREKLETLLAEHLEHHIRLEKSGVMFAAGPLFDAEGKNAGGLIIVRAGSFEEARAIADSDPFHREGFRKYTLQRWSMNEGRLNVSVDFSDQSVRMD
jgi:uncharacterized protein YciI